MLHGDPLIRFRLDDRTGIPSYRQLVDQVGHAVKMGLLQPGDQLPSVRDVVSQISINPTTVHRAYRELEVAGLIEGRAGVGTFVTQTAAASTSAEDQVRLIGSLRSWVDDARSAGVDDTGIIAMVTAMLVDVADPITGNDQGGTTSTWTVESLGGPTPSRVNNVDEKAEAK